MEICGGQTHNIVRSGIDRILPDSIRLVHGPGCPVCVTPVELIDRAVAVAARPEVIFCSFGDMIRVPMPPLTEERRRDLTRIVGRRIEEAKVAVRNVRRDLNHDLKELKDEKLISEDDFQRGEKQLQEVTDKYISQIEEIGRAKDAEIMEV